MTNADRLKTVAERTARDLAENPNLGKGRGKTKVSARDGLTCHIKDGEWRLVADVPESAGGQNAGPDPGVLIRAAFGSCLAMDYMTWAARLEVPVDGVDVEVQSELDARGMYGVAADVPPGYSELRYLVTFHSTADEADILRVMEIAEAHNPRLYDITHPLPVKRHVRIERPVGQPAT